MGKQYIRYRGRVGSIGAYSIRKVPKPLHSLLYLCQLDKAGVADEKDINTLNRLRYTIGSVMKQMECPVLERLIELRYMYGMMLRQPWDIALCM